MMLPTGPYGENDCAAAYPKRSAVRSVEERSEIRSVVHNVQDILKLDLRTMRVLIAELMGFSEVVIDDDQEMHGLLEGTLQRVPNYPEDTHFTDDILSRLEWNGVAYALRYEPHGAGNHYGFYLKGAHVLGRSRAIAACRGFLLASLQTSDQAHAAAVAAMVH